MATVRWDLLTLALVYFFVVCVGVGVYYMRKYGRAAKDFAVASMTLPWWLVATGIVLGPFGAGHTLSPSEAAWVFGAGPVLWPILGGCLSLTIMVFLTGRWYREMGVVTIGEAFERLFGRGTSLLVMLPSVMTMMGICSLEFYATGAALYGFTGLDMRVCIVLAWIFFMIYVIFAGVMQAAVVNLINIVVYYIGVILALVGWTSVLAPIGGWKVAEQYIVQAVGPAGMGLYSPVFGEVLLGLGIPIAIAHAWFCIINQGFNQPILSARDVKAVTKGWPLIMALNSSATAAWVIHGLLSRSVPLGIYPPEVREVVAALRAQGAAVPTNIVTAVTVLGPVGSGGLLLALWVATLSTGALFLLGSGTMITEDLVRRWIKPDITDRGALTLYRVMIVVFGLLAMLGAQFMPFLIAAFLWLFTWTTPLAIALIYGKLWKASRRALMATTIICWAVHALWTVFAPAIPGLPAWLMPGPGSAYVPTILAVVLYPAIAAAEKKS